LALILGSRIGVFYGPCYPGRWGQFHSADHGSHADFRKTHSAGPTCGAAGCLTISTAAAHTAIGLWRPRSKYAFDEPAWGHSAMKRLLLLLLVPLAAPENAGRAKRL